MSSLTATPELSRRLLELIEKFRGVPLLVIGDMIVDHYIWGKVDRISPEAPVVVVNVVNEDKRLGGAGNVASNLISLGAQVSVCGVVGGDSAGSDFCQLASQLGISGEGLVRDLSRPTTVKTRIIAHAQQVVRVDREDSSLISSQVSQDLEQVVHGLLLKSKAVIISDYGKGAISRSLVQRVIVSARQANEGRGIPVLIDPKAPNFDCYQGATIIKPNRKEAEEASGRKIRSRQEALEVGRYLLQVWDSQMVLITLGDQGIVLVSRDGGMENEIEIDTQALEVYDVSGAGDTVSATFALALAAGGSTGEAAMIANYAAGIVVGEVGTVPVQVEQLIRRIQRGTVSI